MQNKITEYKFLSDNSRNYSRIFAWQNVISIPYEIKIKGHFLMALNGLYILFQVLGTSGGFGKYTSQYQGSSCVCLLLAG